MDELDGDVAGVLAPLGRHAPHRRPSRAPPGERERKVAASNLAEQVLL
jgi:hypothetical protein